MYVCNSFVTAIIVYNKNVDIKFSAHDASLEQLSSGTLKIERLESHIIYL